MKQTQKDDHSRLLIFLLTKRMRRTDMFPFADAVAGENDHLYQVHVSWYIVLVRGNFYWDGLLIFFHVLFSHSKNLFVFGWFWLILILNVLHLGGKYYFVMHWKYTNHIAVG